MPRFDRTYRLLVGKPGDMGDQVLPPMHITFDVEANDQPEPNRTQVSVWNLSERKRKAWQQPDSSAVLYAGYAEENGATLLSSGNITEAWTEQVGADSVTHAQWGDGYVAVRDTAVSLGYGAGVTASSIIRSIASQMGLALSMGDVPDRTWAHGFAYYGSAHEGLSKITRATGLVWSIQNGQLRITERGGHTVNTAFVLNASSGMIGGPMRLVAGATEKAKVKNTVTGSNVDVVSTKQQVDGWRVKSLLLPSVQPKDQIKIESKNVTGWFTVASVRHLGDWGGSGDWTSEFDVKP